MKTSSMCLGTETATSGGTDRTTADGIWSLNIKYWWNSEPKNSSSMEFTNTDHSVFPQTLWECEWELPITAHVFQHVAPSQWCCLWRVRRCGHAVGRTLLVVGHLRVSSYSWFAIFTEVISQLPVSTTTPLHYDPFLSLWKYKPKHILSPVRGSWCLIIAT